MPSNSLKDGVFSRKKIPSVTHNLNHRWDLSLFSLFLIYEFHVLSAPYRQLLEKPDAKSTHQIALTGAFTDLFFFCFLFGFDFRLFSSTPAFLLLPRFHIVNVVHDNLIFRVKGSIQSVGKLSTLRIFKG